MEHKAQKNLTRKIIGVILIAVGLGGLVYAGLSQFADGMDRNAAAGTLLFSLVVMFIGIVQLYKKHPDDY